MWILPESERLESPNRNRGRREFTPDILMLHFAVDGDQAPDDEDIDQMDETFGLGFSERDASDDCMDVARLFANPKREASTHFVLGRDGSKVQCVSLDDTAWGAGGGRLPLEGTGALSEGIGYINRRATQIELCNAGYAVDNLRIPKEWRSVSMAHPGNRYKKLTWELFRPEQYATLEYLAALLRQTQPTLRFVTSHEDVVNSHVLSRKKGRKVFGGKVDLGPAFDWGRVDWDSMGYIPIRYNFKIRAWEERTILQSWTEG